jgi:hypothetical protein
MDVEGLHRNFAYAQATHEWILSLDADERVTLELKDELTRVLQAPVRYQGYAIPRRNYIGRYWVRYGGQYPSPQLRLFRKGHFKYEEVEVHPRAFLDGECGQLHGDIIHYSYKDFSDFLRKLNHQTSLEAKKWFDERRKIGIFGCLRKTCDRFLRTFILKRGYKDRFMGFMVAAFAGLYQLMSYAKYWELLKKEKQE